MKAVFALFCLLATTQSALAYPTHDFWCGIHNKDVHKQLLIEVEDKDRDSGMATVYLSDFSDTAEKVGWVPFLVTQAKTQLTWETLYGMSAITGVEIDLGRSGKISAKITKPYGPSLMDGVGTITANVMNFNFPEGVETEYCSYFFVTSPKPALTGSN